MNKKLIILAVLVSLSMAGNYLDNYFCTNEICQQYQVDCKVVTTANQKFCDAKALFLDCVQKIDVNQSSDQKNKAYNDCRALVTYDTGANFFYFLNCQVNCGYQALWLNCATELTQIGLCSGDSCTTPDFNDWNTLYTQCYDTEKKNLCSYVYADLKIDCENSVKSKCKFSASKQLGKSNKYVDLMYCDSNSLILASISLVSLFVFFLF